jgi:hypothetical protein
MVGAETPGSPVPFEIAGASLDKSAELGALDKRPDPERQPDGATSQGPKKAEQKRLAARKCRCVSCNVALG